jgi:ATP-binding cassette subfamily B protein
MRFTRLSPRVPYIAQLETSECGAACLAMVLAYHGHHAPLPEVREVCAVSRDGVNARAILQAAESYGLRAHAYRIELDGLSQIPLPAILHWQFDHFVVLEHLERSGTAQIIDPARGRLKVKIETLGSSFTGVAFIFTPTESLRPRPPQTVNIKRYREAIRAHAGSMAQLVLLSLLLQSAGFAFPVGQQLLVDRVLVHRQISWLWTLTAALVLAALIQSALQFARGWILGALHTVFDLRLLGEFIRHLVRLPLGFFLQRHPGDLLQRLESNNSLRSFFGSQIVTSLLDGLLIIGYGTLMFVYSWKLAFLVLGLGTVRGAYQLVIHGLNRQAQAAELNAMSAAGGTLLESLGGLETIKAVSAEPVAIRRWSDHLVRRANASLPRRQLEYTGSQITVLLNGLGITAVSAMAGYQVLQGEMTIGVFSAFLSLQGLFLTPFNSLVENLEHWQFLNSHLARLDDVLAAKPEPSGELDAAGLQGKIRLRGVGFRYASASPWVLRGIDVRVRPGEKIAIVGPSGAGKTTLARLLLGLLLPTEGAVSFDGHDLTRYDLGRLRARMGVVLQETSFLDDTVEANIGMHDPSISLEQMRIAARLACIDKEIESLPHGYATFLGERGIHLSGGEQQRLGLARALVHRPAILLLDEATSSLDSATEQRVQANLQKLGCTRITIAHRLATIRDADRIFVLSQGHIVEEGTFDELSVHPGLFRDLLDSLGGLDE